MALPPTPPSSNPNSPTSPTTTTSEGDAVINFDADIEKQNYNNEKLTDFNKSAPRENGSPDCAESEHIARHHQMDGTLTRTLGPPKYSLHRRISEYVRSMSHSEKMPRLSGTWRRPRSSEIETRIQRSRAPTTRDLLKQLSKRLYSRRSPKGLPAASCICQQRPKLLDVQTLWIFAFSSITLPARRACAAGERARRP